MSQDQATGLPPEPLRRVDRYALLTALSHKPRAARLAWGSKHHQGLILAWPRVGGISFRVDGGVAAGLGLPDEGSIVELRFRIRGLSYRCEGPVRQAGRDKGRIMVRPESVEWCARRVDVQGAGIIQLSALINVKAPDGDRHVASVIGLGSDAIRFVCWPCPQQLQGTPQIPARLDLPGFGRAELTLRVHGASPAFPGSRGRIMTAEPVGDTAAFEELLGRITGTERSVA
mgnify:CR=1 FL=1